MDDELIREGAALFEEATRAINSETAFDAGLVGRLEAMKNRLHDLGDEYTERQFEDVIGKLRAKPSKRLGNDCG
jgi:hypothetical protein